MAKRAPALAQPAIMLDPRAAAPLYRQLYERLRGQILTGRLDAGARLPSTRTLAGTLGVSRSTTALAYDLLLQEGYVESRVGDGTRVARLRAQPLWPASAPPPTPAPPHRGSPVSRRGRALADLPYPEIVAVREGGADENPFRISQPDVAHFPYATWGRLVARHARHSLPDAALYQQALGHAPLQAAIAAHVGLARGVRCAPEQVVITAGAQGALALVAQVLLDPGDPVWLEDPGYTGARGALLAAGAAPIPVPVDREGLDVAVGRRLCPHARLAVVTPSHQFPTGVTMSLRRRLALLAWAGEADAWIVEDDYDSEYRFGGRPLEALHGLDDAGRVLYVGTFSKVLFPALRLGYLVAPPGLLPAVLAARRFVDIHPPILEQLALADFIAEGHFARHLRRMRPLYQARRDALVEALQAELGGLLDVVVPQAGLNLAAWLPAGPCGPAVAARVAARGLAPPALSQFSRRPLARDGWVFGFAVASPEALRAGVHRLARAARAAR
ncbi:MAG TPA: PLP-dependent aminotransferase family protein [Thermomicrobiales bacterium]|nr:PLP-dependent aminotransferase family protein [Thermomicrobiales bacterium]